MLRNKDSAKNKGNISHRSNILNTEKWHTLEYEAICSKLHSSNNGISSEEAAKRLIRYGSNALPVKEPPTIWTILLHQVKNPLIFILLAAAAASLVIGEITDAIFIFVVIMLNSALGAYQEYNAEKSAASLQNLLRIKTRVRRNQNELEIPSEELVPGDIVLLESGHKVSADLRLFEANNLTSDESFLTGESIAAPKNTAILSEDIGVSERSNMAFAGSTILAGRGWGIVVSTGINTEVGKIADHVN